MEMCRGLKDQMVYDAKGLKCLGELSRKDMERVYRDMVETAADFIEENITDEISGSHGDSPPMTDEGRRADDQDQHAMRQSSKPKPISQDRTS